MPQTHTIDRTTKITLGAVIAAIPFLVGAVVYTAALQSKVEMVVKEQAKGNQIMEKIVDKLDVLGRVTTVLSTQYDVLKDLGKQRDDRIEQLASRVRALEQAK